MTSTSTLLVKSLFGETTGPEEMVLQHQMAESSAVLDEYIEMLEIRQELANERRSPSKTSIRIILEYSREKAESTGVEG